MSLLIKALDKAQSAKAEEAQAQRAKSGRATAKQQKTGLDNPADNAGLGLSLSPAANKLDAPMDESRQTVGAIDQASTDLNTAPKQAAVSIGAKSAANVFSAKGMAPKKDSKLLAIVAGLALASLLGMGAYFYRFVDNTPEVPVLPRLAQPQLQPQVEAKLQVAAITQAEVLPTQNAGVTQEEVVQNAPPAKLRSEEAAANLPPIITSNETVVLNQAEPRPTKLTHKKLIHIDDEAFATAENEDEASAPEVKINNKAGKSKTLKLNNAIASDSASITPSGVSVSKTKSQGEVSPTLMRAYEAYNAGNDAEAQKLYKQVLQHDVRNVDALLGLGAIAQRQGRVADANGWFGKVLEVEPRNSIAQAAMLDSATQSNDINNETHLKNMLAKQPDDANLYVELGNYYAAQNQWSSAQQAYFDAYRLRANADNALNLAVSLDQMGKPKLALPYYQRALELAKTGSNSIDKAVLEARIAAIQ